MTQTRYLGIWMDHSVAHLMEYTHDPIGTVTVASKFTHQAKENAIGKSENLMHNKEQHLQAEYYKNIGEVIKNYNEVLLFGPTAAKVELLNSLRSDNNFSKIKIEIKQADKMTENQQHALVKEHFSKQ